MQNMLMILAIYLQEKLTITPVIKKYLSDSVEYVYFICDT